MSHTRSVGESSEDLIDQRRTVTWESRWNMVMTAAVWVLALSCCKFDVSDYCGWDICNVVDVYVSMCH